MTGIALQIAFVLVLLLVNGMLAMSEMAVISSRRARLQSMADEGNAGAKVALELADQPSRLLSTVQIGITMVGILAGALGGATLAEEVSARLATLPYVGPHAGPVGFGIVVASISYLSLLLGELVPKRLALASPEVVAAFVAAPLRAVSRLASPLVRVLSASTEGVLRLLRVRADSPSPVTEEEIKILIEQGAEAGVFEETEQDMFARVLRLRERRVDLVMTPRKDIVALDLEAPFEQNLKRFETGHAQFPVIRGRLDNVLGVVRVRDILPAVLGGRGLDRGKSLDLRTFLLEPLFVPEATPALKLLERFRASGVHIALVIDEYSSIQGVVTLTDILAAIVGELPAAGQAPKASMVEREDGSWLVDGILALQDFKESVGLDALPGDDRGHFHTVGGFVLTHLGKIPKAGDHFDVEGVRFEVVDMDGFRVDKVMVTPPHRDAPAAEDELRTAGGAPSPGATPGA